MTEIEEKVHQIDKRQENFETYMKMRQDSFEEYVKASIENTNELIKTSIANTNEILKQQRERIDKFETKHEMDIKRLEDKMDSKFDELGKEVRGIGRYVNALVITTIVGVVGIAGALITFIKSTLP